jgi:hypothetical protein
MSNKRVAGVGRVVAQSFARNAYAGICESRITQFSIPRLNASRNSVGRHAVLALVGAGGPTKEIPQCPIIA